MLDRLRKELESKKCKLTKGQTRVNRVVLAAKLGLSPVALDSAPCLALVEAKDAQLMELATADPTTAIFQNRVFIFGDIDAWSESFLARSANRFGQVFEGSSEGTAKANYLALRKALVWIGSSSNPHCRAVVSNSREGQIKGESWEEAVHAYREFYLSSADGKKSPISASTQIGCLNSAFRALSSGGVVPALSLPLMGVKNASRKAGHRKSLAETVGADEASKSRYIEFARSAMQQAGRKYGVSIEGDAFDFLRTLESETGEGSELPSNPAEAVLMLVTKRINVLVQHAEAVLRRWVARREEGRELLANTSIDAGSFAGLWGHKNRTERIAMIRDWFPISSPLLNEHRKTGIGNLLAVAEANFDGLLPGKQAIETFGQFFQKRYLEYGGFYEIDSYLNPHRDACFAALTLYLCESGANLAVARTLDADCIEDSDLPGYVRITGHKARAKGKPIIVDLPRKSATIEALSWLREETVRIRRKLTEPDSSLLFLVRVGERCQSMSVNRYSAWFTSFAAKIPGLEGLRLTPSMIRPTVLLRSALENDGRLQVGMAIGQHTQQVTQGYQVKWPTRLLYDQHLRRFQEAFETLVIRNIDAAAEKLGIEPQEFKRRLETLRETGLGTYCKDPFGRPESKGEQCTTLDCWNSCPQMVIVAEIESIALLQIWQGALRVVRPNWERDQPDRWDAVWLPWLSLIDAIEEKMSRGPLLKIWNQARARRKTIESTVQFVPPNPW